MLSQKRVNMPIRMTKRYLTLKPTRFICMRANNIIMAARARYQAVWEKMCSRKRPLKIRRKAKSLRTFGFMVIPPDLFFQHSIGGLKFT
jgi:hypothetical protein